MAKNRFTLPPMQNVIRNVITDAEGNELDDFITENSTQLMPDGSIGTEKIAYSKIGADGAAYNPSMGMGARPERVGSCFFCEKRSHSNSGKSSLVNLKYARFCEGCGRLGCLHHVSKRRDGKFRCSWCHAKNKAKRTARLLFFRRDYVDR